MDTNGILYGIGVGPGDPENMTLKAVRVIQECDIIVLPSKTIEECYAYQIAVHAVPVLAEKTCLCRPFPMVREARELELAHDRIYQELEEYLDEGKKVGLLTIGDPSVYSTYMYIHHRAVAAGKRAEMICGIPSFCAAAARLGISLGEKTEEIHVIPASYSAEESLKLHGTRIYMKSGKKLRELIALLKLSHEKLQNVPDSGQQGVAYEYFGVSNCGMENEKLYYGLEELQAAEGYLTIIIVKEKRVWRENSYRFFENRDCKYFPCHKGLTEFNCLFCYCPLYTRQHCPGTPEYITKPDGRVIKNCSGCTFPHQPESYDIMMQFLKM